MLVGFVDFEGMKAPLCGASAYLAGSMTKSSSCPKWRARAEPDLIESGGIPKSGVK
jgi:hypothetical protein